MEPLSLKGLQVSKEFLKEVNSNISYNLDIIGFYEEYSREIFSPSLKNKGARLKDCNRFWQIDRYDLSKVKDFQKTNLCLDKFCNNCKRVKQAARMARFIPEIEKYDKDGLYHMVLTVPNVMGHELKDSIKKLFKAFTRLSEYLKGKKRIKGLDFNYWGYIGAIRSFEVTFQGDEYHPHLHIGLALTGELGRKKYKNIYSYDGHKKKADRLFSQEEILIQKIWYLLINGIKVTKKEIDCLELGYSCMIDKFKQGDYIELFKYMTKNDRGSMDYDNFKVLYESLDGLRQIQGYGVFFRIKEDDSIIEQVDEVYNGMLQELQDRENPVKVVEAPQDLVKDNEYLLISRKKVFNYLRDNSVV